METHGMSKRKVRDDWRMIWMSRPPTIQMFMEQISSLKNVCYLGLTPKHLGLTPKQTPKHLLHVHYAARPAYQR